MRIIVAIDDTAATQPLLDAVIGMGWGEGTEVALATFVRFEHKSTHERNQHFTVAVQGELEAIKNELQAVLPHCEIAYIVREGDPREEIITLANEIRADMILLGTNNRAVGSVSQAVLNAAPCPVLIAKNDTERVHDVQTGFRTVVVPFDNSIYSQASLAWLLQLKWLQNATFVLLTVVDASPHQAQDEEAMKEIDEALFYGAQKLREGLRSGRVKTRVGYGKPDDAILGIAREMGADLIVMGSHGRTGIKKMILGSVSSEVSRRANCSVLVVRGIARKDRSWQRTGVMTMPKHKAPPVEEVPDDCVGETRRNDVPHVIPGGMH